ncbi:putative transposase [Trichonephila clavipes]|uniref:Putative transposase n=1 Tax=Trichonephila clavipes TaxID=2585209 RepID=A0A8X6WII8_TRICX|nr:putative transposase [Trichonephila clavipes]
MITNFFIPELNNHDVQELWFQQDIATCHTARATIDLLKDMFGDHLISRFGPVNWPPRSCDLTLLDYFLWGYVKSLVYADKPQMLDHLEENIRRVIADIRPQMLEKVIENWTSRLDYIRGSPMPEIIFKIWVLHHDNAPCLTAISVNRFVASKNIPVAPQPPYLLDLSPCDFFLFPRLKNHLKGHHFGTVENIQTAITDQLKAIPISEFHQYYEEWKKRLQRCVASEGSYFEGDNVKL